MKEQSLLVVHPKFGELTVSALIEKLTTVTCKGCGKKFTVSPFKQNKKYCSLECSRRNVWTKGKTAENCPKLRKVGKKISEVNTQKYATGELVIWNKGLTKEIDSRITGVPGDKNPSKRPEVREKIRKTIIERWANPKNREKLLLVAGFGSESKEHHDLKLGIARYLELRGYKIGIEVPVKINDKLYVIDIVVNKNIAIECGGCRKEKLLTLKEFFNIVIHIPYNGKITKFSKMSLEKKEKTKNEK